MEKEKREEHWVAGLVGAFLGSLLGTIVIVIVSQLGYIAGICGLVMAVCTLKGYELLGGGLSRKGAVISILLTLGMTYVAHQIDWAISIAMELEIDPFTAFRSIGWLLREGLLDRPIYWGNLCMLYLFVLLGAAPMLLSALRGRSEEPPQKPFQEPFQNPWDNDPPLDPDLVVYPAKESWLRPLRISTVLSLLAMIFFSILYPLFSYIIHPDNSWSSLLWLAFASVLIPIIFSAIAIWLMQPADAFRWVFVRSHGNLWRVDLTALNIPACYHFTEKNAFPRGIRWSKLSPAEQDRAKHSIQQAIYNLSKQGIPASQSQRSAVCILCDPQLTRESKWTWHISYSSSSNPLEESPRRKNMVIAKAYPNFAPVSDTTPPAQPLPIRWGWILLTLLISLGTLAGTYLLGDSSSAVTYQSYEQMGMTFQIDETWDAIPPRQFIDTKSGVLYTITVSPGATEDTATEALTAPIQQHRLSPNFEGFAFSNPSAEGTLHEMTAEDGTLYRYELVRLDFSDRSGTYTAAALADNGFLTVVEAEYGPEHQHTQVQNAISDLLSHMRFTGPTEENYTSLFHVARELGYETVSIAYIHSPDEQRGFMRIPLPAGGEPEYLADGDAVRTSAHGLRVLASAAYSPDGPQPILEEAFARIQAEGRDLVPNGVFEIRYQPEDDVAIKQVGFLENGHPRISFLAAQPLMQEGYYRYMEVTYIPEEMDDAYAMTIKDFGEAADLVLPVLDPF